VSPRKLIKEYGSHGRSVRVFVETFTDPKRQPLVRVEWRERDSKGRLKRKTESLPDSRDNQKRAKAFAEGVAERLALHGVAHVQPVTMRELGDRYLLAHPTPETWRPKTRQTFLNRWKVVVAFMTPERRIDTVTPETLDELRAALRGQGYAVNQIGNHVQLVKSMFRFARGRKYLSENAIADYAMKLSRDQRRLEVPEWSAQECARILAQLDPKSSRNWRAYVAIVLAALQGTRINALLHLEWRDVDLIERTVRWRPELDKLARDRTQPLPRDAVRVLRIARVWRARLKYEGPFVFPAGVVEQRGQTREREAWELDPKHKRAGRKSRRAGDKPFTYSGIHGALKDAAARAGVRWIDYRAMHGFRRFILNQVLGQTGNLTRAGQWIGDTDVRTLTRSYVRSRPEELRDVANAVRLPELAEEEA
jgi:integrase